MVNCEKMEDAESLERCVCTITSINRRDSAARRSTGSPLAMFASPVSNGVGATMGGGVRLIDCRVSKAFPPAMFASAERWG